MCFTCLTQNVYRGRTVYGPWEEISYIPLHGGINGSFEDAYLFTDPRGNWHTLFHVYRLTRPAVRSQTQNLFDCTRACGR